MSGKFYGKTPFDPWLVVTQIVLLQASWYVVLGTFVTICNLLTAEPTSGSQFFRSDQYTWSTRRGCQLILAQWVCALLFAPYLSVVVGRAKKVLDYCGTIQFWHWVFMMGWEVPGRIRGGGVR